MWSIIDWVLNAIIASTLTPTPVGDDEPAKDDEDNGVCTTDENSDEEFWECETGDESASSSSGANKGGYCLTDDECQCLEFWDKSYSSTTSSSEPNEYEHGENEQCVEDEFWRSLRSLAEVDDIQYEVHDPLSRRYVVVADETRFLLCVSCRHVRRKTLIDQRNRREREKGNPINERTDYKDPPDNDYEVHNEEGISYVVVGNIRRNLLLPLPECPPCKRRSKKRKRNAGRQ